MGEAYGFSQSMHPKWLAPSFISAVRIILTSVSKLCFRWEISQTHLLYRFSRNSKLSTKGWFWKPPQPQPVSSRPPTPPHHVGLTFSPPTRILPNYRCVFFHRETTAQSSTLWPPIRRRFTAPPPLRSPLLKWRDALQKKREDNSFRGRGASRAAVGLGAQRGCATRQGESGRGEGGRGGGVRPWCG